MSKDAASATSSIPATTANEISMEICIHGSTIIFAPMNASTNASPAVRKRSRPSTPASRKYIARDPEDGGNRIDRQRDIRDLDNQKNHKQRRREELSAFFHKETFAAVVMRDAQMPARKDGNPVALGMHLLFLLEQHMQSRIHKKCAKHIQHPAESLDQPRSRGNHCASHDQRPEDAPLQ